MAGKFDTMNELMAELHCENWPERWNEIYPQVIEDYRKNGCKYTLCETYDEFHEKYGVFNDFLDVYKQAASEVAKSEPLSIFLALLCEVLRDRENAPKEMGFSMPVSSDGGPCLAIDMLRALAMASTVPYSYEKMKKLGIPDEIAVKTLCMPENSIRRYMERYNGNYGFDLIGWFQFSVDCKLYRLGRLEIEVDRKFNADATVFRNVHNGKIIILASGMLLHKSGFPLGTVGFEDEKDSYTATICETEDSWTGYPCSEYGNVRSTPVTLSKKDWCKMLEKDDFIINLHIPSGGGMTPELVDDSIQQGIEFVAKYYPDYKYKAFCCHSWLMDHQLDKLLGSDSNIAKFEKRFHKIAFKSDGKGVFYHAFSRNRNEVTDVSLLPEHTSLLRKLKQHYMSGKYIYETYGVFFR